MEKAVPLEHGRILSYDVDGHRVWLNVDAAFRDGEGVVVTHISPGGNGHSNGPAHPDDGDGPEAPDENGGKGGPTGDGGPEGRHEGPGGTTDGMGRTVRTGDETGTAQEGGPSRVPAPSERTFSPEIASRALWAMKVFRLPHYQVRVEKLDLERPGLSRFVSSSPMDLKLFKKHVASMCSAWEAIRSEEDAPAAPSRDRCRACAFATACEQGKGFVGKGASA